MPRTPNDAPVRRFAQTEVAAGVILVVASVVALAWANSPWRAGYESLWSTTVQLHVGSLHFDEDLRHVVNEGLMAVFFFVIGLEIKRELVAGELRQWRAAALPVIAALGGMAVPALLFTAFNAGGRGARGWGVPMATDIAFAMAVIALLGSHVPPPLKLFLLTLAIVDDAGAIVVIAVFYAGGVRFTALALAAAGVVAIVVLRALGVRWAPVFVVLGIVVWFATFESGIHATIAGAVLGLLVPAGPLGDRLHDHLHPDAGLVIVPLFALANAGVRLRGDAFGAPGAWAVFAGVAIGLVVGKALGVSAATWVAVRTGIGRLPEGTSWRQVVGVASVAGIGFTVSLFITDVAFGETVLEPSAKIAILVASAVAAVIGAAILAAAPKRDR